MRRLELIIDGMRCRRCARRASGMLRDVPGVVTLTADPRTGTATLGGSMTPDLVLDALAAGGFAARVSHDSAAP